MTDLHTHCVVAPGELEYLTLDGRSRWVPGAEQFQIDERQSTPDLLMVWLRARTAAVRMRAELARRGVPVGSFDDD